MGAWFMTELFGNKAKKAAEAQARAIRETTDQQVKAMNEQAAAIQQQNILDIQTRKINQEVAALSESALPRAQDQATVSLLPEEEQSTPVSKKKKDFFRANRTNLSGINL